MCKTCINFLAKKTPITEVASDDGRLYFYDCCNCIYVVCISPSSRDGMVMIIEIIPIERRIFRLSVSRIDSWVDSEYDTVQISLFDFCPTKQYSNRRLRGCQDFFVFCFRLQWHPNFDIMPNRGNHNFTSLRAQLSKEQLNTFRSP